MDPSTIPKRLSHLKSQDCIDALAKKVKSSRSTFRFKDPKSVFGKVVKDLISKESNLEERLYLYNLWLKHKDEFEMAKNTKPSAKAHKQDRDKIYRRQREAKDLRKNKKGRKITSAVHTNQNPDEAQNQVPPECTSKEDDDYNEDRLHRVIQKFNIDIQKYPTFTCNICKRLVYENSTNVKNFTFKQKIILEFERNEFREFREGDTIRTCRRCSDIMSRNKIPPMYYRNNLQTETAPECISRLNEVEIRMISQVKLFMKIFHTQKGRGQMALKGSCLHFPQSVDEIIEKLPLNPNAADIFLVNESDEQGTKLEEYRVRGKYLFEALKYLKSNNPLYKNVIIEEANDELLQPAEIPVTSNENKIYETETDHSRGFDAIDEKRFILRGTIHQATATAFPLGGNQCTAMAIAAIAHCVINCVSNWASHDLDNIIFAGDKHYVNLVPTRDRYLDAFEATTIPVLCFDSISVKCIAETSNVYAGCFNKVTGSDLTRMPVSIKAFVESEYQFGLLTANVYSMALIKKNDFLYIFDSHSRGPKGCTSLNGSACVIKFAIEMAPDEISKLVHRNCQPNEKYKQTMTELEKSRYLYVITPINCTIESEDLRNGDVLDKSMSNDENQKISGHVNDIPLQAMKNPNQVMLDCVIRCDEIAEPTVQQYLMSCKNKNNVISEVNLCRQKGNPMYPEKEQHLEELAFIKAFPNGCNGLNEKRKIPITPLDYFQQRVMGENNAFHSNEYLFYALSQVERHIIQQKIAVCANMASNNGIVNQDNDEEIQLPGLDNVHLYMQGIRGSGSYWKKYTGEVLSMIEGLGIPTFFLTISYDDLNSQDALTALWKASYGKDSELEKHPKDMEYTEKRDLLNNNPVAAARHFSYRMNVILSLIKQNGQYLFGANVSDYTYRVEFQGRGSPHVHALFWLEDAPDFETADGIDFINKNISCSIEVPFKDLVLRYQQHRHTSTCFKKHNICRFGFPRKPIAETKVLDEEETRKNHGRFLEIRRKNDEVMINNYHPKLLQILKCNMDIQAVTGCRAIAYYVGKYMSKGEPTHLREEIRNIINNFKTGTKSTYYEKAKKIAAAIIRQREISSQECAFRLCHLMLRNSSRGFVFIPSYQPQNRIRLVKKETIFNSEPQLGMNIIDRYMKRPNSLSELSLYEFAAWWRPKPKKYNEINEEMVENEIMDENVEGFTESLQLLDNKGTIQRRKVHAIVKYPKFRQLEQTDDYLYSMILLYKPFRDESLLLEGFVSIRAAFDGYRTQFRSHENDSIINPGLLEQIESVMLQLEQEALRNEQQDNQEEEDYDLFPIEQHDIINERDMFQENQRAVESLAQRLRCLNSEQRKLFDMVQSKLSNQCGTKQILHFCQGGAGVGKSFLIQCISDFVCTTHHAKERAVIRAAPTGVAARNIRGVTLHKAFSLGVEQHGLAQYIKLSGRTLEERRKIFKDVIFIIIDEVSMISYNVLRMIHLRLCEIFGNDEPFGKTNILLFGDLLQLQPVRGTWCFQIPKNFMHEDNLWDRFSFSELHKVLRQKESDPFTNILQRLRIGTLLREDVAKLSERVLCSETEDYDNMLRGSNSSLHLYPKIFMVDAYNEKRLNDMKKSGIKVYKIHSDDRFASGLKYGRKAPSELIHSDMRKCAGIPTILEIGVGMKTMLKWNIDPLGGLCNGSIGIVRGFKWTGLRRDQLKEGDLPESVYVEFEGKISAHHLSKDTGFSNSVEVKARSFEFTGKRGMQICRTQVPLIPSFACSIHKSQGITVESCTVDLGKDLFTTGLAYVALSRVTSFQGLYITGMDENQLLVNRNGKSPCNEKALRELYRLKLRSFLEVDVLPISSKTLDSLLDFVLEFVFCKACKNWICLCSCK